MVAKTDSNIFTVFISHKEDDHSLAIEVKKVLEGLARPKLDCFVSGIAMIHRHARPLPRAHQQDAAEIARKTFHHSRRSHP
jgi:hypothetical protein